MSFFTPAPTPPSTSDPINFNTRADAFLAWMATFATQSEAYGAFLSAANMFGVVIPYIFDTTTTDADPGAGKLRLGNATQNLSTVIRADLADSQAGDATSLLAWMATGTSTVKGMVRLMKAGDSRVWIYAEVTALATPTGYRNMTINVIASSSANPFADGDAVILAFVPKGDKGDPVQLDVAPDFYVIEEGATPTPSAGNRSIRQLDTVYRNRFGWGFASYVLTLPAGDYMAWASCPARGIGSNSAFLRNVTDSSDILEGLIYAADNVGSFNFPCRAGIELRPFTLAAQKNVRLEHYVSSVPSGAGLSLGSSSKNAALAIWKRN